MNKPSSRTELDHSDIQPRPSVRVLAPGSLIIPVNRIGIDMVSHAVDGYSKHDALMHSHIDIDPKDYIPHS